MVKNTTLSFIVVLLALAITVTGCGKKEKETPQPDPARDQVQVEPGIAKQPAVEAVKTDLWIQDFEEAKKIATDQGKDILINFTGSDWCRFCIMLEKEVFEQQAFIDAIPKKFVLLKLDFPDDESLITPAIKAQNIKLKTQYPFKGYPTIILTDATGKHYAQTGYHPGGAKKYIEHLNELQKSK